MNFTSDFDSMENSTYSVHENRIIAYIENTLNYHNKKLQSIKNKVDKANNRKMLTAKLLATLKAHDVAIFYCNTINYNFKGNNDEYIAGHPEHPETIETCNMSQEDYVKWMDKYGIAGHIRRNGSLWK